MPRYSQWLIRTALLWLALGSTIGGLMLANKGLPFWQDLWALRWAHVHTLLVGWTLQFTCGVAAWMLPRPIVLGWRGDIRLVWLCYLGLNAGVLCGITPGICGLIGFRASLDGMYVLAGLCYAIAAVAWICHAWPRIIPSLRDQIAGV